MSFRNTIKAKGYYEIGFNKFQLDKGAFIRLQVLKFMTMQNNRLITSIFLKSKCKPWHMA